MKYESFLIVVESIEVSRKFYEEIFGLKVVCDFGANITFDSGFSLQSKETWVDFIGKRKEEIIRKSNNFELYFEEENFDSFYKLLKQKPDIELIHDEKEFRWGQRAVRFYDPDQHIIEAAESMKAVA